jgi:hypothetical protein
MIRVKVRGRVGVTSLSSAFLFFETGSSVLSLNANRTLFATASELASALEVAVEVALEVRVRIRDWVRVRMI